jgi:nucleotide-binding universal stress UspA family protein
VIARILCPIDLSDFSTRAFQHALALGRWFGADVVALHVLAPGAPAAGRAAGPEATEPTPEARAPIERQLRDLIRPTPAGRKLPLVVREGDPAKEILAQAASMPADLIVVSTHGRSGFERLALGSVTEKVMRKATCPVLVVPAEGSAASQPFTGYRRIVCAMDFSDSSRAALAYALSIAGHAGASVTLVHVVEALDGPGVIEEGAPFAALRRAQVEAAQGVLHGIVKEHQGLGCAIDEVVVPGSPHRQLLRVAGEKEADLLVMGVHGRGPVDLALFGSTANQVVRRAPYAVLTVRTR